MNRKIPKFKSEDKERKFWATHDSTEFIDWKKARKVLLPNLKPSVRTISLRIPETLLEELKLLANKRDVPYQSLLKIFLSEKLREEFNMFKGLIQENSINAIKEELYNCFYNRKHLLMVSTLPPIVKEVLEDALHGVFDKKKLKRFLMNEEKNNPNSTDKSDLALRRAIKGYISPKRIRHRAIPTSY